MIQRMLSAEECGALEQISTNLLELDDIEDPPSVKFWGRVMVGLRLDCTPLSLVMVLEEFSCDNKYNAERSLAEFARYTLPEKKTERKPRSTENSKPNWYAENPERLEKMENLIDELGIPISVQIGIPGIRFIASEMKNRYGSNLSAPTVRRMIAAIRGKRGLVIPGGSGQVRWQPDSHRASTGTCATANT